MAPQLDVLTRVNLDDLVSSFGWQERPMLASLLRRICINPARKFAQRMIDFDDAVGRTELCDASRQITQQLFVREVRVYGREHLPAAGPALFLSNHPGMTDTICLFAAINRANLKIIASRNAFLVALENTAKSCCFIDSDPANRLAAARQVSKHLRQGGSALTFPAGEIEPDPEVYPGALQSLDKWTDSAGLLMRLAPETRIIPVLVSGVIWQYAARHWLARLKRTRIEREKLAAAVQLLAMISRKARPTTVKVRFARPISLDEVGSRGSKAIHQVVISRMRVLLQHSSADR